MPHKQRGDILIMRPQWLGLNGRQFVQQPGCPYYDQHLISFEVFCQASKMQPNGSSGNKPTLKKQPTDQSDLEDKDIFKILITTDNHLGFKEGDKTVGNDSFYSFDEALSVQSKRANEKKVDFVLLGGDLFHEQKPSRKTYESSVVTKLQRSSISMSSGHKSYKQSKKYTLLILSLPQIIFWIQQAPAFDTFQYQKANYLSPSLSVKMPIFSIHGNHDDPTGLDMLSSLDQACINNYLNQTHTRIPVSKLEHRDLKHSFVQIVYFGKVKNIEKIEVTPVLFQKGETRIALYGLGHIKDERLNLAFEIIIFT